LYAVIAKPNGKYICECGIQDGTERWEEDTLEEALQSVVRAAKTLNGTYLRPDQIARLTQQELPVERAVSDEDWQLLEAIKSKHKVVLDHDHHLIKYNLSQGECELIQALREGNAIVTWRRSA
jgi:hypothetical protein